MGPLVKKNIAVAVIFIVTVAVIVLIAFVLPMLTPQKGSTVFPPVTPPKERVIVETTIKLTDASWYREYFADLKKGEVVHIQFTVTGSPTDFYIETERQGSTVTLMQKAETLSEDFTWAVPEDGRYIFTIELADENASVKLKITVK